MPPLGAASQRVRRTRHALCIACLLVVHKCNKSTRRKIGKFRKAAVPERAPGARAPNSQRPIMASLWSSRARRRARPAALQSPRRNGALHPRFDSHLLRDMISTSNFWFSQVVVHSQLHLRMCSGGPEGARSKSLRQSKMVRPAALPHWSTTFVVPVIALHQSAAHAPPLPRVPSPWLGAAP